MPRFEILPGLPPYGPMAKQFSPDGKGAHREGLVVRFPDAQCGEWVASFQEGDEPILSKVLPHPDDRYVLVIAGGIGYVVNPDAAELVELLGEDVREILPVPGTRDLLIATGQSVSRLSATGWHWRSRRLALDGISDLRIEGLWVHGVDAHPDLITRQFRISLQEGRDMQSTFLSRILNGVRTLRSRHSHK